MSRYAARWAELGTLDTAVIRKVGYKKIFADNLSVFIATSCSSPSPPSQSITRCGPEFGDQGEVGQTTENIQDPAS